jgi:hypothetical protein
MARDVVVNLHGVRNVQVMDHIFPEKVVRKNLGPRPVPVHHLRVHTRASQVRGRTYCASR